MSRIICQMYGLRHALAQDPVYCLQRVKEIGFEAVQLDGYRGHTREEIKEALDRAELKVSSMHIKHELFRDQLEQIIYDCHFFACSEVYLKYIDDEYQNLAGYHATKIMLEKALPILRAEGISLGLHSPEYDFNCLVDGEVVMDYICLNSEIAPEPDTYWLKVAERDPLTYCQKYKGRILTLHCKDIDTKAGALEDMERNIRECGAGEVDFMSLLSWGYQNGVRHFAIEQDYSAGDIFVSMKKSYEHLRALEKKILTEE